MFSYFVGPCEKKKCSNNARCIVHSDRTAQCVCTLCREDEKYAPVCGSNGRTYATKCRMNLDSCIKKKEITPMKEGPCGK